MADVVTLHRGIPSAFGRTVARRWPPLRRSVPALLLSGNGFRLHRTTGDLRGDDQRRTNESARTFSVTATGTTRVHLRILGV